MMRENESDGDSGWVQPPGYAGPSASREAGHGAHGVHETHGVQGADGRAAPGPALPRRIFQRSQTMTDRTERICPSHEGGSNYWSAS